MHISLLWLQDYVDLKGLSIAEISSTLTQLGLEVEGVQTLKPLEGPVVVGQILKAQQHPNADKLRLCQVDVGGGEVLSIVCGAPNAREGIKVVVARIGAVLPQDFKIKESKIRGEASFGMLCSESELGLSESHDGIIELPPLAPLGQSITDYLQLNDTVFEIGLTPNRSDCLGVIGVARDLAAKLGRSFRLPAQHPEWSKENLDSAQKIRIQIQNPQDSRRFVGLYVQNLRALPSPTWLQRRVANAGMRPINLIVDATNFVMLETGQPIHAYDERDVQGGLLQVRRAAEGEKLKTLDGQERALTAQDLLIADGNKAVGLAGIMGGENSEVKSDTQNIVIEVAHFHPSLVRKTAKRFALHTEASHRFERGIDLAHVAWVARRVAEVMYQASHDLRAQGYDLPLPEIAGRAVDVYPEEHKPLEVKLRLSRLRQFTANPELPAKEAQDILERLGLKVIKHDAETTLWQIPSWRQDLEREVDLIEEIARVRGYDKIPSKLPRMQLGALPEHPLIDFLDQNKVALAHLGLSEIISFPFMSVDDAKSLGLTTQHPLSASIRLANPLVEQHRLLRTTMIPGLLRAVYENRRHGVQGVQLFEAARTFHEPRNLPSELSKVWKHVATQGAHIPVKAIKDDRPLEHSRVAGILDQPFTQKSWNQPEIRADFFHAKSIILRYLSSFGVEDVKCIAIEAQDYPWLHPGASATLWTAKGDFLGYAGELHPRTAKAFELDAQSPPVVFELHLEAIFAASRQTQTYASGAQKFPPVARDLALIVPESVRFDQFEAAFLAFKKRKYLQDTRLFDVYQGPNIPAGKKSMAFSLVFQSDEKTLTDKDVEKEVELLLGWLKDELSAELR